MYVEKHISKGKGKIEKFKKKRIINPFTNLLIMNRKRLNEKLNIREQITKHVDLR